mgnify:CR=1 FL=1
MIREFGVKFEIETGDGFIPFEDLDFLAFTIGEILEEFDDSGNYNSFGKIYVAKESESIFEPMEFDLGGFTREDGISTVAQYYNGSFINGNFKILKKYRPNLIMRDNKHFFNPEIENNE